MMPNSVTSQIVKTSDSADYSFIPFFRVFRVFRGKKHHVYNY